MTGIDELFNGIGTDAELCVTSNQSDRIAIYSQLQGKFEEQRLVEPGPHPARIVSKSGLAYFSDRHSGKDGPPFSGATNGLQVLVGKLATGSYLVTLKFAAPVNRTFELHATAAGDCLMAVGPAIGNSEHVAQATWLISGRKIVLNSGGG
jgi:hypothetical protein